MALADNNGMVMPVAPTGGNFGGDFMGNGSGWWIILLFILLGYGNGFGFGGGNGGGYPVQQGFNQAALQSGINDIQSMNALSTQFANCCCENRLGIADLKATILAENCADRAAVGDGIRDIIVNQNQNTQRIIDQMCADKIDAKNERIAELQQQLYMRDLAASQAEQTAALQAGQRALANEVEQYVLPTPRPAYVVANPNCCQQFGGCGCGVA